ncbi:ABC transporter G family member 16 [Ananas comosus]|uniref:ABC transporter G family member 16 n=1 Tax=Ananas comosus TaxID=4615 RepID=A0A199W2M7_ANACO|nr:ABC transporter G family member 16 [Ananas comosus]
MDDNLENRHRGHAPTLGELLKHVGDAASPLPPHYAVDLHKVDDKEGEEDEKGEGLRGGVPFVLEFRDVSYRIRAGRRWPRLLRRRAEGHRTLLEAVSGEAREGEILAIMGASGSGKSTLIDALANRIPRRRLGGSVTLNGERVSGRLLRSISAYVMQDDLLFPMLTVEETLTFAAEFRLPRSLPREKKRARVRALIDQLGLRPAASTIIGDESHRGVSGGERRRVSIGAEIVHDPVLLFLDEPTSGLDSASALMVARVLRRIARAGSVVVASVHQPSRRVLGLVDRLLILSRGRAAYCGDPRRLANFLAAFGRPVPAGESPAEFALDAVRSLEPGASSSLAEFNTAWRLAEFNAAAAPPPPLRDAIAASISRGKLVSSRGGGGVAAHANPAWAEVGALARRGALNARRAPELLLTRLGAVVVTGFLLATVFWRLDASPRGVQERLGFFAFAMSTTFYTCADALPVFLHERNVFMRETAYNAYRRSSYVLANALVSFPPLLLLAGAFSAVTFPAVGLRGGAAGLGYYFAAALASFWAGSGFVTFLSGVVSHVMLGYTCVVALLAYFLLFSGFFIARRPHPPLLALYPYEGIMRNEFGREGECFARGAQIFEGSPLGELPGELRGRVLAAIGEALGVAIADDTCLTTGADVLRQQAVTQLGKWQALAVTVAWGFFFRLLFYVALLLGSKNRRR